MVSKCCFCFDLTFSYLTFSIIVLEVKVCSIVCMHYYTSYMTEKMKSMADVMAPVGMSIGYLLFTGVCLFISIKGIIQKRSILMFPYTVVLVTEIIATFVAYLIASPALGPPVVFGILVTNGIQAYILIHHISVYRFYKNGECQIIPSNGYQNLLLHHQ